MQSSGENNFHVFYILLQQAPNGLKNELHLNACSKFSYLKYGWESPTICSPVHSFDVMDMALLNLGFSVETKKMIYKWIAAILHLGNIKIIESGGYSEISESSISSLTYAADLLDISSHELKKALLVHVIESTKEV